MSTTIQSLDEVRPRLELFNEKAAALEQSRFFAWLTGGPRRPDYAEIPGGDWLAYLIVFRETGPQTARADQFDGRLRTEFPDALSEYDAGVYLVSTTLPAADVLTSVAPPNGVEFLLELELSATGAIGCAGSDFICELRKKISIRKPRK